MLRTRLLTAAVLIAVLLTVLFAYPHPVLVMFLCSLFVAGAGTEFSALRWLAVRSSEGAADLPRPPLEGSHFLSGGLMAGFLWVWFFASAAGLETLPWLMAWVTLSGLVWAATLYVREASLRIAADAFASAVGGFGYIAMPGLALYRLSVLEASPQVPAAALVWALAVIFMGDTGAYFVGRTWGRRKLIPRVSPKKTVEGAMGGLVASVVTAGGLAVAFSLQVPWWVAAPAGALMGVAGQVGDLVESAIKRAASCKDSGSLLPGHGGVLDRIDSLLLSMPIALALFLAYHS